MKKKIFIILFLTVIVLNSFAFPFFKVGKKGFGDKDKLKEKGRTRFIDFNRLIPIDFGSWSSFEDAIEDLPYIDPHTAKSDGTILFIGTDFIVVWIDGQAYVSTLKQ